MRTNRDTVRESEVTLCVHELITPKSVLDINNQTKKNKGKIQNT